MTKNKMSSSTELPFGTSDGCSRTCRGQSGKIFKKILAWTLVLALVFPVAVTGNVKDAKAAGSKVLNINWNNIKAVGNQPQGSQACACYALAYCRTLLDGRVHSWGEYDAYGGGNPNNCAASWTSGGYGSANVGTAQQAYRACYDSINSNRPAILFVTGSRTDWHYVTVVGYQNVSNPNALSASNFLIIDSCWFCAKDRTENMASAGYSAKYAGGEYTYHVTNSGSVPSPAPADTVKPTISNVKMTDISTRGYTVTFNVSDNVGVTSVKCPTWTVGGGQDDLIWHDVPVNKGQCSFTLDYSTHKYQTEGYATHIYVYDKAGNEIRYTSLPLVNLLKADAYGTAEYPDEFRALISVPTGTASGKSVTAPAAGGEIALNTTNRKDRYQQWNFKKNADGSYCITNIGNGQNLDVYNKGTANQTKIQSYPPNNSTAQQWFIYKDKKGDTVHLTPACSKTSTLDCGKNGAKNAHLWVYNSSGENPNQMLKIDQLIDPTGISIDSAEESGNVIYIGDSEQLNVSCTPENADFDQSDVTFTSSDEDVLTVDKSGKVTALSAGEATVTAAYGDDISAEITYTVKKPVNSIMINAENRELYKGDTESLDVIYRPLDADFDEGKVMYTSSDEDVVTVDEDGTLTAVGSGDAVVTASYDALQDSIDVTVHGKKVENLTIDSDDVDEESENVIHPGDTAELKIGCYPEDADFDRSRLTFESSDEDVLTVDEDGVITPVSDGTATITVKYGDTVAKELTYSVKEPVSSISIYGNTSGSHEIYVGDKIYILVNCSPAGADFIRSNTQFSSSDESVATVDSTGYVTGVSAGTADITAKYGDLEDTVTVTVKEKEQAKFGVVPIGKSDVMETGDIVRSDTTGGESGSSGAQGQNATGNQPAAGNGAGQQNGSTAPGAGNGQTAAGSAGQKDKVSAKISTAIKSVRQTGRNASKTGKIKVRYKKVKSASVYQVQYSLNKKFKKGKKYRTTTVYTSSTSARLKKLERSSLKGRRFYVRVRPIMNNGKNGAWSKVKKSRVR